MKWFKYPNHSPNLFGSYLVTVKIAKTPKLYVTLSHWTRFGVENKLVASSDAIEEDDGYGHKTYCWNGWEHPNQLGLDWSKRIIAWMRRPRPFKEKQ